MRCFSIYFDELEERLDCEFYSPTNRVQLRSKFPIMAIKELTHNIIHPPEYKRIYAEQGYQLLRAQNVRSSGIEIDAKPVFFDKTHLTNKRLIFPEVGDVLVVRSGVNTGDCAVIDRKYEDVILGADNLICKCKATIAPGFLKTYLSSDVGRRLLNKYITGATNSHITPENLGKVKIPLPPLTVQRQIVEVMDAAYARKQQHEEEAECLLGSIGEYVIKELGIKLPAIGKERCYVVDSGEADRERLDPHYFKPEFKELVHQLKKLAHMFLGEAVTFSNEIWNQQDTFEKQFPYIEISAIDIATGEIGEVAYHSKKDAPSRARMIVRKNDIVASLTRPHRGAIALIDESKNGHIASTGLAVLRDLKTDRLTKEFLFFLLRSELSLRQMLQRSSGGNYPAITEEELKQLIIPVPPLKIQQQMTQTITKRQTEAKKLRTEALQLVEQAKQEVEKLLLGK